MSKSGFIKTASVQTIGVATFQEGEGLKKSAAYEEDKSSKFMSGHPIDIRAKLELIANEYNISDDPNDYVFEAIRGLTANVPNENKDGFHKSELLRFDHKLGKQVYRTFENKPHHINHRADNPKNARGFIVDAHYNDSASPLDSCPNCGNKTASEKERDPETGIHCRKCGEVVKDEFVELLVAIDTKKDATFANGVMNGILKNGSMGCSCVRTRCNVCSNVAYTRGEFCKHIASNKGKEYTESEPGFNPVAFILRQKNGKLIKIAVSHEWCEGVIYDEYSRVHDPADPKAEQYEILRVAQKINQLENDEQLRSESEILTLQARLTQLEKTVQDKFAKIAQKGSDVNIDISAPGGGPENVEIESEEPLEETPGAGAGTPIGELTPEAMGLTPAGPGKQMSPPAVGMAQPPPPPAPGGAAPMPPAPPPPRRGSKESKTLLRALENLGGPSMLRFAKSYKHIKAEVTSAGNVRIFDDEGTMFVVKPGSIPEGSKIAGKTDEDLAKSVLTMIAEHGIGGTVKRTAAIVGPRLAQVLDYYMDDMLNEERGKTESVLDNTESDTQEKRTKDKKTETATGTGEDSDMKEKRETKDVKNVDVLTGRETDVEDEQHDREPGSLSAVEMHDSDMRDKRKDWSLSQSAVDDISVDHKEKVASAETDITAASDTKAESDTEATTDTEAAKECKEASTVDVKKHATRLERLYSKRLEAKQAEIEKDKKAFVDTFKDRFIRAMKIIARRQALNLEHSPLKEAFGVALCNPRPLGDGFEYEPMDARLAVHLVEAAFDEPLIEGVDKSPWEAFIDGMFDRAASVMDMSDESLMQIEADLQNMQAAAVSVEVGAPVAPRTADANMRHAANAGNLQLSPTGSEAVVADPDKKRSAIRQAVGTTKVATSRSSLGV